MEDRVQAVEAKLCAVTHFLLWIGLISAFNFGVALWYFQLSAHVEWNSIAVTLTIFEMFLVIALAGGFWMLRGAAQDAASKTAKEISIPIAEEAARKAALGWFGLAAASASNSANTGDSEDLDSMIRSLSDNGGGEK